MVDSTRDQIYSASSFRIQCLTRLREGKPFETRNNRCKHETKTTVNAGFGEHAVVPRDQWLKAGKALLDKEKEFTRLRDELSEQRRNLPWTPIDKSYKFETEAGPKSLAELFGGKSQLIVYHYMFWPGSQHRLPRLFVADHFDTVAQPPGRSRGSPLSPWRAPRWRSSCPLQEADGFGGSKWIPHPPDFNYDFDAAFHEEELSRRPRSASTSSSSKACKVKTSRE